MNLHDHDIRYEALQEGAQIGAQNKAVEAAKTMLSDKFPPEKVSHYSGLSLEQVLELQESILVKA